MWGPNSQPHESALDKVAMWIRVQSLPMEYYLALSIWKIGQVIGLVLKFESYKEGLNKKQFARVCV